MLIIYVLLIVTIFTFNILWFLQGQILMGERKDFVIKGRGQKINILITGGAQGLGCGLSELFFQNHFDTCRLILVDVREDLFL